MYCPVFTRAENGRRWSFPSGTTINSCLSLEFRYSAEKLVEEALRPGAGSVFSLHQARTDTASLPAPKRISRRQSVAVDGIACDGERVRVRIAQHDTRQKARKRSGRVAVRADVTGTGGGSFESGSVPSCCSVL